METLPGMNFIKQYGYYRTGTNYTAVLLERNLKNTKVITNGLGCKHDPAENWANWIDTNNRASGKKKKQLPKNLVAMVVAGQVGTVVTVKNPYAWLVSFLKYWKRRRVRSDAINDRFVRKRCRIFNKNYKQWCRLDNLVILQYERLLVDPLKLVRTVSEKFKIPLVDVPSNIDTRVDPHEHIRTDPFSPLYFTEERYMNDLLPKHKAILDKEIDWTFFKRFGYVKRKP